LEDGGKAGKTIEAMYRRTLKDLLHELEDVTYIDSRGVHFEDEAEDDE
jgi:hypothetical protein